MNLMHICAVAAISVGLVFCGPAFDALAAADDQ